MAGRGPSFKDVTIEFYSGGVEGVKAYALKHDIARTTLEKAAESLEVDRGADVRELNALIVELHGEKGEGGRGRSAPVLGETRDYKVQQVKDGGPFGRIPMDTLGLEKGGACSTQFLEDAEGPYMVIRPKRQTPATVEVNLDD